MAMERNPECIRGADRRDCRLHTTEVGVYSKSLGGTGRRKFMGPRVRCGSKNFGLFRGVEKWVHGQVESEAQMWLLRRLLRAIAGEAGGSALGRLQGSLRKLELD